MVEHDSTPDDRGLFVLYDPDRRSLATTEVFGSYTEAAEAIDSRMQNVVILRLPFDEGPPEPNDDEPCVCQQPGDFCSGVPGILAQMKDGKLASETSVERCDVCERYPSDDAALEKLRELGMVPEDYLDDRRCSNSPDGRHAADPASARGADGAGRNRGTDWLIDFNCLHCGQSGALRVNPADIKWA